MANPTSAAAQKLIAEQIARNVAVGNYEKALDEVEPIHFEEIGEWQGDPRYFPAHAPVETSPLLTDTVNEAGTVERITITGTIRDMTLWERIRRWIGW